jgi:putative ATPase
MNLKSPLAERMRPLKLDEFIGQAEIIGPDSFLREAIKNDQVPSLIFWGPPGSGKTSLAAIIAKETGAEFTKLSAVTSGLKELKVIIQDAEAANRLGGKTILFLDEIHRWNKAQQDALLPHTESGLITLIGATTENPSFRVNSALLSRTRVLVLKALTAEDLQAILQKALEDKTRGLASSNLKLEPQALRQIADLANGDARQALNLLEICAKQSSKITLELVTKIAKNTTLFYDQAGEEHYNLISALHKSIRGSDPHAALYWLARMLEGGEDPLYLARRLIRIASEDVGLKDSFALVLANSVYDVCHKLGLPECDVHLAHLVVYLAKTQKSILAYQSLKQARVDAKTKGNLPVPLHLRNAPTKLMQELEYGKNYRYSPLEDSSKQEYFPEELRGRRYF